MTLQPTQSRLRSAVTTATPSRLRTGFRVLFAACLLPFSLSAQELATGTIRGRVFNVGNSRYLPNVRVSVEGTLLETQTNDYGEFRVNGVPVGPARVRAQYTGLDPETATVNVTAGGITSYDFNLSSRDRYGDDKRIVLDSLTVAASREFEGNSLATNEQRYAPNVKVVMAADAFGDVTEGNAGEFLKYLPGITVDYVAADVRTVAVRGFAANFTNVYLDGMRTTSSASGASGRIFEFEQVSINNASRVEVVKVPTPDIPADALGGSVNLVSKNAFEQRGASFDYRAYLSFNSENLNAFKKTPGPGNKETYKVLPGFDFTYVLPVNDRFGIVVTGLNSNQFNEQHRWQTTWNYAQAGATPANPYLQQWQIQDGPKNTTRASVSLKADWKFTPTQTLSVSVQDNYYKAFFGNRNLNFNMGTNQVPTPATGTPLLWGPTFVQAATGRATVTHGSSFRDKLGDTRAGNIRYLFNGRLWNGGAGVFAAQSKTWYREITRGQFSNVGTTMQNVSVVRADSINFPDHNWSVQNAAGQQLNPYDLTNYRVTTAQNSPVDGKATMKGTYVDVRRDLDFLSIPLSVKVGLAVREEDRDNRRYTEQWQFVGADGVPNTADDSATPFLDTVYSAEDPHWGEPKIQWLNPYKLYDHYKANPNHFRQGTAVTQQVGVLAETNRINNSEKITERISSAYIQFDGKVLDNRLQFVAGLRYEKTRDQGEGVLANPDAVFQTNPDGSYVDGNPTTAGIQRVRRADAGTAGSLEELKLMRVERGYKDTRDYDDIYPSVHLTYKIADDLLARFSYARSLGRPDYANIIPLTTLDFNDTDPNSAGTLTTRNTGLKPWTADNYDLSLEYYFQKGGVFSFGAFQKDISDFWISRPSAPLSAGEAADLGLDSRFVGWAVATTINGGSAQVAGREFNLTRTLDFLPGFARYLTLSANGTKLELKGEQGAAFGGFISKTGNVSLSWNKQPISARVTWNYRGRQRGISYNASGLQTGAQYGATTGFYEYFAPRYNIDVNFEYSFSKRVHLFANARNIFNEPQTVERYSEESSSAPYARGFRAEEFGVQYSLGVKGTW